MFKPSGQDPSRLGRAAARLAGALERLETALAAERATGPEVEGLAEALAAAKRESAETRERERDLTQRLDGAIARLRAMLGEAK